MRNLILFVMMMVATVAIGQYRNVPIDSIPPGLMKDAVLVDVRTPEEFNQGHLPGAVNVNWLQDDFAQRMKAYRKEERLLLYCRSGNRSSKAGAMLDSLGYQQVYNLTGGYMKYLETKKP